MGYAQLDDTFWCNPKIVDLPALALRLYVRSISFSSALNTGGAVSKGTLRVLDGNAKLAAELVKASLWDADGDAWKVHDYEQYNISKAKRDAARANARKRWEPSESTVSHDAKPEISHDAKPPTPLPISHHPQEKVAGTGAGKEQQDLASCDAKNDTAPQPVPRAFQLAEAIVGRELTRIEYELISDRCSERDPKWVCAALEATREAGVASLNYAWKVLESYGEVGPPERRNPNGNHRNGIRNGNGISAADAEENERLTARLEERTRQRLGLAPVQDVPLTGG
jgi:hypothetical protein